MLQESLVRLASLSPRQVTCRELAALCRSGEADGNTYVCRATPAGSANVDLFCALPEEDGACRGVAQALARRGAHAWAEESVVLCNFPCYLVTGCGAIVTPDGKIVAGSLYPSAGDSTFEQFLGLEVRPVGLGGLVAAAGRLATTRPCASYFSRWSGVYFHAVSECLVQEDIYRRIGILPHIDFVAPSDLSGTQRKLVDCRRPKLQCADDGIVAVPRALFCTVGGRHAALGLDFRRTIDGLRLAAFEQAAALAQMPSPQRIYVSRAGEEARPLLNELEVVEIFERHGFRAVRPQEFSLLEQVKLFSDAAVVAGPHGSGLLNAAFARPKALLFEFCALHRTGRASAMTESSYRKLAAVMGLRYGFFIAENKPDSDAWSIPAERAAAIAEMLARA